MKGNISVLGQQIRLLRTTIPQIIAEDIVNVQPIVPVAFNKRYWPYQHYVGFKYNYNELREIERWCWRHFKGRYWRSLDGFYAFKRQKDYNWFMLRWSK